MTGQHTLRIEAARAGVSVTEYQARLDKGQLWCYHCLDWHEAEAFPADGRRHTGRGESCVQSLRDEARAAIADRGAFPPPPAAASWVIKRPEPAPDPPGGVAWAYWRGPGRSRRPGTNRAGTWSPALDESVARFPDADQAHAALVAAFGDPGAVPPGCKLVRLALTARREAPASSPLRAPAAAWRRLREPDRPARGEASSPLAADTPPGTHQRAAMPEFWASTSAARPPLGAM